MLFKCFFAFMMMNDSMAGIEFMHEGDTIPTHPSVLLPYDSEERVWVMLHIPDSKGQAYGCYQFDDPKNSYVIMENIEFNTLNGWLDEEYFYTN